MTRVNLAYDADDGRIQVIVSNNLLELSPLATPKAMKGLDL